MRPPSLTRPEVRSGGLAETLGVAALACAAGLGANFSVQLLDESLSVAQAFGRVYHGSGRPFLGLTLALAGALWLSRRLRPHWSSTLMAGGLGLATLAWLDPGWAATHYSWSFVLAFALALWGLCHLPPWRSLRGLLAEPSDWLELRRSQSLWNNLSRMQKGLFLGVGSLAIVGWQSSYLFRPPPELPAYRQQAALGVVPNLERFVDALYRFDYYPLAQVTVLDAQGQPTSPAWYTELGFATRFGENAKAYLFLPKCYWQGNSDNPSCSPSNFLFFTLALIVLFLNGCRLGFPTLSLVLVVLLGSNPFQLQEVYARSNIFSWTLSSAILLLGLHLGYLLRPGPLRGLAWAGAIGCGVLLASLRQVRTEPALMAISVLLTLTFCARSKAWTRIALGGLLMLSVFSAQALWKDFFSSKIRQAERVCRQWGGVPYSGPREDHHIVWHTLWIGLGDYGQDGGFAWNDKAAWAYALPILREQFGLDIQLNQSGYYLTTNWDNQLPYPRLLTDYHDYEQVMKARVVSAISANPIWYGGILLRRINRVLHETTPIRILGLPLPFHGLLVLPLLMVLAIRRSRLALLILFVVPTSATALAIYSGRGTCLSSMYHLVSAALLLTFVWERALPRCPLAGGDASTGGSSPPA